MRYLGSNFSLTIAGMRLRIRIDLDDVPESQDVRRDEGTPEHVDVKRRVVPHHLRTPRA
jgi:hypothetical protein